MCVYVVGSKLWTMYYYIGKQKIRSTETIKHTVAARPKGGWRQYRGWWQENQVFQENGEIHFAANFGYAKIGPIFFLDT